MGKILHDNDQLHIVSMWWAMALIFHHQYVRPDSRQLLLFLVRHGHQLLINYIFSFVFHFKDLSEWGSIWVTKPYLQVDPNIAIVLSQMFSSFSTAVACSFQTWPFFAYDWHTVRWYVGSFQIGVHKQYYQNCSCSFVENFGTWVLWWLLWWCAALQSWR